MGWAQDQVLRAAVPSHRWAGSACWTHVSGGHRPPGGAAGPGEAASVPQEGPSWWPPPDQGGVAWGSASRQVRGWGEVRRAVSWPTQERGTEEANPDPSSEPSGPLLPPARGAGGEAMVTGCHMVSRSSCGTDLTSLTPTSDPERLRHPPVPHSLAEGPAGLRAPSQPRPAPSAQPWAAPATPRNECSRPLTQLRTPRPCQRPPAGSSLPLGPGPRVVGAGLRPAPLRACARPTRRQGPHLTRQEAEAAGGGAVVQVRSQVRGELATH